MGTARGRAKRLDHRGKSWFLGPEEVIIIGAGKVGTALAVGLRGAGTQVRLCSVRRSFPKRIDSTLMVLAVKDGDVLHIAERVAQLPRTAKVRAALHCAGSLGISSLAPLRDARLAIGIMHPLISFVGGPINWSNATLAIAGDPPARALARRVARLLGMVARPLGRLDVAGYHAAAAMLANGAAALAEGSTQLLSASGTSNEVARAMLAPLLRSVADNLAHPAVANTLSGPVRRGDATAIRKHISAIAALAPGLWPTYVASVRTQLPLSRALGEAKATDLREIEALISHRMATPRRSSR